MSSSTASALQAALTGKKMPKASEQWDGEHKQIGDAIVGLWLEMRGLDVITDRRRFAGWVERASGTLVSCGLHARGADR